MNATPRDPDKLFEEVKRKLHVGSLMAQTLVRSHDEDWQRMIVDRYGGDLSASEKG